MSHILLLPGEGAGLVRISPAKSTGTLFTALGPPVCAHLELNNILHRPFYYSYAQVSFTSCHQSVSDLCKPWQRVIVEFFVFAHVTQAANIRRARLIHAAVLIEPLLIAFISEEAYRVSGL